MMRIALATCREYPSLYAEEQDLLRLLRDRNVSAAAAIWDAPEVRWSDFDVVVFRSTWDYVQRFPEFKLWLKRLRRLRVPTLNSLSLVEWNLDKRYLAELGRAGVRVIPTAFVNPGEAVDLAALVRERGWSEAILKPAISAGSFKTHRFAAADAASFQGKLEAVLAASSALVQPYYPEIELEGECSFHFFGARFSHACVKRPVPGDFRVQWRFGGTFERIEPAAALLDDARAVLAALPEKPTYARVDGVCRDGQFHLMEVELIEPYLHLSTDADAPARFVDAILSASPAL